MRFSFGRNIWRRAIERGLANGKLKEEFDELEDVKLESRRDGEAVCWGLEQLHGGVAGFGEQTYRLARLFQEVEDVDCDAIEVLRERGIPELLRLYDEIHNAAGDDHTDALLFLLKMFALYGTTDGTLKVIEAAQEPLNPDGYMWSVILGSYEAGHPQNELLYGSLKAPLPGGFMAIALLDAANKAMIGGESMLHPFDSPEGKTRFRQWLTNEDRGEYSYAHSATAALPFISNPERDALLELGMRHPAREVRLEAMWAAAKLGREAGFQALVEQCRDFRTAEAAKRYLTELGREALIPPETKEGGFAALAEFAQWCAHPNELGRIPDELEIVDHRELPWPPERKAKPFWLIQYRLHAETALDEEQVGCGLVGSVTWAFFSYALEQRPPEDAYAIHCCWEMEQHRLIVETEIEQAAGEYAGLVQQWQGLPLTNVLLLRLAEISPQLQYPQRLVGVASASLEGEAGWVVLDGGRSEWYRRADQPGEDDDRVILRIHVGSQLLGLTGKRDRKKCLRPAQKVVAAPEEIIAAYENLLAKAKRLAEKKRERAFACFGPVASHLEKYADALVAAGRAAELRPVIELLRPHWDHANGFSALSMVAWKAGHFDIAEELLLKLRDLGGQYERGEGMDLLADLWCRTGRADPARGLLLDCLRRLLEASKTAKGSDKQLFEQWFQSKRASFCKLFPEGEAVLMREGVPPSTLRQLP